MENHIEAISNVVSAFLSHNSVRAEDVPSLLKDVHDAIVNLGKPPEPSAPERRKPAHDLSVKKSIGHDELISYLDGKGYKTLKRHVATHGMTMDEYRAEFGLPKDYPSVAPGYSARRSELAKSNDLGHVRGKQRAAAAALSSNERLSEPARKKAPAKKAEKKVTPHLKPKDRKEAAEPAESAAEAA